MHRKTTNTRVVGPSRTQLQHGVAFYDVKHIRPLHSLIHSTPNGLVTNVQRKRCPNEVDRPPFVDESRRQRSTPDIVLCGHGICRELLRQVETEGDGTACIVARMCACQHHNRQHDSPDEAHSHHLFSLSIAFSCNSQSQLLNHRHSPHPSPLRFNSSVRVDSRLTYP
jgi:hypothetical protein